MTVNGIPGWVFGNEFIVNHVPPDKDGLHTLTAVATDMGGRAAEASIRVAAQSYLIATGDFPENRGFHPADVGCRSRDAAFRNRSGTERNL